MSPITKNKSVTLFLAPLVACVGVLVTDSPARATNGTFTWGRFISRNGGQCMGVLQGVVQEGHPVVEWPCNGNPDQTWGWSNNSPFPNDAQQIVNFANPFMCLSENPNGQQGAQLIVTQCSTAGSTSLWQPTLITGAAPGTYMLQGAGPFVAAVSLGAGTGNPPGTNPGTGIITWVQQIPTDGSEGDVSTIHQEQQWQLP